MIRAYSRRQASVSTSIRDPVQLARAHSLEYVAVGLGGREDPAYFVVVPTTQFRSILYHHLTACAGKYYFHHLVLCLLFREGVLSQISFSRLPSLA